jgi:hypothetical protein
MDVALNPETGRLPVQVVEHLHRLLGGDPRVERMVEIYIGHRWQAKTLLHLPPSVAREILRRPADFLTAVKKHCEPELFAEGQFLTTNGH